MRGTGVDAETSVRIGHEKTLVSQRFTEKNQGLGAMRALGLEPRTQGLKVHGATNENVDETTTPQQIQQQLESIDSHDDLATNEKTMCLAVAIDSVRNSRRAVEKLLDSISMDDHYSMGILGPILAGLRDAEREIADSLYRKAVNDLEGEVERDCHVAINF